MKKNLILGSTLIEEKNAELRLPHKKGWGGGGVNSLSKLWNLWELICLSHILLRKIYP